MATSNKKELSTTQRLSRSFLRWLRSIVTHNFGYKALALGLAILLWGMVREDQDVEEVVNVALSIDTPDDLIYLNQVSQYINVRLSGPRSRLRNADEANLHMTIDLAGAAPGNNMFNPAQFKIQNLPTGVVVAAFYPPLLTMDVDRLIEKEVSIEVRLEGDTADDFRLVSAVVSPRSVFLEGPARQLEPMDSIKTEQINITGIRQDLHYRVALDYGETSVSPKGRHDPIDVAVKVEKVWLKRSFEGIHIQLTGENERFEIRPTTAQVDVEGPLSQVEALTQGFVRLAFTPPEASQDKNPPLTIQFNAKGKIKEGAKPLQAQLTRVRSPDVKIIKITPEKFTLIDKGETPIPEEGEQTP